MVKNLSPGYLRVGGTMADRLIFVRKSSQSMMNYLTEINIKSGYGNSEGYKSNLLNFTFTGKNYFRGFAFVLLVGDFR